jgi:hypothetical protein
MSLAAVTDRVHSDGAIPPIRNYFLLMQREGVRQKVSESMSESLSENVSESVSDSVSDSVAGSVTVIV